MLISFYSFWDTKNQYQLFQGIAFQQFYFHKCLDASLSKEKREEQYYPHFALNLFMNLSIVTGDLFLERIYMLWSSNTWYLETLDINISHLNQTKLSKQFLTFVLNSPDIGILNVLLIIYSKNQFWASVHYSMLTSPPVYE